MENRGRMHNTVVG